MSLEENHWQMLADISENYGKKELKSWQEDSFFTELQFFTMFMTDMGVSESAIANALGVTVGNIRGKKGTVKEKREKARKTLPFFPRQENKEYVKQMNRIHKSMKQEKRTQKVREAFED